MSLTNIDIKKAVVLLLLLSASFSLYAQNFRELKIYVPPVAGEGAQEDNAYFYGRLSYEVAFQQHSIVRALRGSDFTLRGSIMTLEEMLSVTAGNSYSFYDARNEGKEAVQAQRAAEQRQGYTGEAFVFNVELLNSATGEVKGDQYIIYNWLDSYVDGFLSTIVYNMLSGIPDIEIVDDWRDRWLFLEASVLWAPRIYKGLYESVSWANFGLRVAAEFHFLNFLSLDVGASLVQDWVVVSAAPKQEYRDLILEAPAALKVVLKPLNYLMLEPYAGISINRSLFNYTKPSTLSWFVGTQLGIKAGPGMVVIDPRFAMDFSKSSVGSVQYQRYMIQIGIGYKFGFFRKKTKADY
ncbi:MAG: hypothetical protein FWF68_06235 [Spirochaetes bacterium]|nr:hypothetical protein [Spirochaetota bacterium]